MTRHESTRGHWERYWATLPELDDVYTTEGRVIEQLLRLSPAGKSELKARYPDDKATGYTPGQVRGAITIRKSA